jgi:hypothetical protein
MRLVLWKKGSAGSSALARAAAKANVHSDAPKKLDWIWADLTQFDQIGLKKIKSRKNA